MLFREPRTPLYDFPPSKKEKTLTHLSIAVGVIKEVTVQQRILIAVLRFYFTHSNSNEQYVDD